MATKKKAPVRKASVSEAVILPPLKQVHSPNYSSRHGAKITLLVYHESAGHYNSDVSWLCNPQAQASAHGVVREDGGEVTQLVHLADKAWAQADFNAIAVGIEHSNLTAKGFASWEQLAVSARLFAWMAWKLDIPIRVASQSHPLGICRHQDLGLAGGGHTQCGMDEPQHTQWMKMIANEHQRGGFRPNYLL